MIPVPDLSDLIGLPFKDGGTGNGGANPGGYDCYGLAREVFFRFGIALPAVNISVTACRQASQQEIDAHVLRLWERIKMPDVPCGVQILSGDRRHANHIATHIGYGKIIHVTLKSRVVIQRLGDYVNRIEGFYRYVGPAR
jgi:cell wall-associated NlpC family hydrolase